MGPKKRWPHPHARNSAFLSAPYPAPPTECNFTCTFDNDFCEWVQADYSSIDWIRNKGPTPTQNTGPSFDHTTGGRNSNQYTAVLQAEGCPWEDGDKPLLTATTGHMFPGLDPELFLARALLEEAFQPWESVCGTRRAGKDLSCKGESNAKLDDPAVSGK